MLARESLASAGRVAAGIVVSRQFRFADYSEERASVINMSPLWKCPSNGLMTDVEHHPTWGVINQLPAGRQQLSPRQQALLRINIAVDRSSCLVSTG